MKLLYKFQQLKYAIPAIISAITICIVATIIYLSNSFERYLFTRLEEASAREQSVIFKATLHNFQDQMEAQTRPFLKSLTKDHIVLGKLDGQLWQESNLGFLNFVNQKFGVESIIVFDENLKVADTLKVHSGIVKVSNKDLYQFIKTSQENDSSEFEYINKGTQDDSRFALSMIFELEDYTFYVAYIINPKDFLNTFNKSYGHETVINAFNFKDPNKQFQKSRYQGLDLIDRGNGLELVRKTPIINPAFKLKTSLISYVNFNGPLNEIKTKKLYLYTTIIIASILGIAVIILFVFMLLKPLFKIETTTKEIRRGNSLYREDYNGKSELDKVGREINKMLDYLALTLESNKKANIEINSLLYKRTIFFSNMSHDLRTPLNGILGAVELLSESHDLNKTDKNYLDAIKVSGNTLLELVGDILDISKIESGNMDINNSNFYLKDFLNEINSISSLLCLKNPDLSFILKSEVKPGLVITADKLRLKQISMNMISNAIKFTKSGTVSFDVKVNSINDEIAIIAFKINDTGIGISQENLLHIFDDYSQAQNDTARKYGGTGLGLSISKHLLERMGSKLKVKSKLHHGTEFYFCLEFPLGTAPAEVLKPIQALSLNGIDFGKEHPLKILVAEDNQINTLVITKTLEKLGLEVVCVESGIEVLEYLDSRNQLDLILMDCLMPHMDGFEATKNIRKNPNFNHIKIIALTANSTSADKEKCFDAGMDAFLSKPINRHKLIDELLKVSLKKAKTKVA